MAREMKDSGVKWIGKIPKDWCVTKLKYIGEYINGYAFKPEQWGDTGKLIIRIQDLTGSNDKPNYYDGEIDKKYNVYNGDILVSWAATLAAFIWNKGDGVLNQHIFKAKNNPEKVVHDYFFWLIRVAMENMNNENKHGIMMQHVTLDVFGNFKVALPLLEEQRRIAKYLENECFRIDAVIEQTRASIEEYKKLKKAVITQAVTKGIQPGRQMKDSGVEWIGEIPAEWTVKKCKHIISSIESGTSVNAAQYPAGRNEIGVLKTSCVSRFRFVPDENKAVNAEELERISCPVKANTIIMSRMNTPDLVGACGYVDSDYPNLYLPDRLWQIHFKANSNVVYLWYYLNSRNIRDYYSSLAVGTSSSMQNISQDQFYNTFILYPPVHEQDEIVSWLDVNIHRYEVLIANKEQLIDQLEAYKKSLIYEYVTGKKEVI